MFYTPVPRCNVTVTA